jgi:Fibronectin type III domain
MTISPTSIGLSWTQPASGGAVSSYTVLSRVSGSGAFSIVATGLTGTSYEVTGLTPTTLYDFAVFGVNANGPGPLSSIITQATEGEVPNPPTGLSASAGSPAYSATVLSWTAPVTDSTNGPASSYVVQYALHGSGSWTTAARGVTATGYTLTGLAHATAYDFQVLGVNSAGTGAASGTATLTTDYAPPNAPSISGVAPVNDGTTSKLTVAWTAPATDATHDAANGYNVRYSVHGAGSWTIMTGVTSPCTITGLSAGTSYDVEVQGTNASTTSPGAWSGIITASTYSCALTWGVSGQPQPSFTHGSGNINGVNNAGTNINTSPTPAAVYLDATTSNTVIPTSGLTSLTDYGSPYYWADYYPVPGTPGTYYLWALAKDGSGDLLGALVSSAITVS